MYTMKFRVTYSHVKDDLKTDMVSIVQFFQDCSIFHSESVGKGLDEIKRVQKAWFLSSWQIEVDRYPEFAEEITVRTWPYLFKGIYGYRNFDILDQDGKQIVRANSIWVFMDTDKMMLTKSTPDDLEGYEIEDAIDMDYAPRKIKLLGEECKSNLGPINPIVVRHSFLDSNHHVNNTRYIMEAMDYIDHPQDVKTLRVDYRKSALLGDCMQPQVYKQENKQQVALIDSDGDVFVAVEML